jgi:serine/threonine protein phosphatase PrpC
MNSEAATLSAVITASNSKLAVERGGYSSAGIKPHNEDAFAAYIPQGNVLALKGITACIADGASCSDNAKLASETSVTHFINDYYSTPDTWPVKTAVARVLSALNSWLFHHGRQQQLQHNGLVTTFSALVIKSTTAHIFHAGDSRIYRLRGKQFELLTQDHTHFQRDGSALLTRALGMESHLEMDYSTEDVEQGDLFMLSTDGVHSVLSQSEILTFLISPQVNLEQRAQALVEAALQKGSTDNISCLLLRVTALPVADIEEVHRQLAQLAIPPVLEAGNSIDGLRVQRVLHSGTRSHLYLVQNSLDKKQYVLKAPSQNFSDDPQYLEGFIREQWVASRIQHAGVMKVFQRPASSPFLYLLCEYIDGQTLRQWLFDNPNPPLEIVREIVAEIVTALRALQRLHMTHRDLKPENIMLMRDGHVKLIDFGTVHIGGLDEIASPLHEDQAVGSADYIAPEYLLGGNGAFYSDMFSLGVIVYEMLTGKLPFNLTPLQQRHLKSVHVYTYTPARTHRADLPLWLDLALQKATQPNINQRYHALSEFLHDLSTPNEDMVRSYKHQPLLQRGSLRFWKLSAIALLAVVLIEAVMLIYRR